MKRLFILLAAAILLSSCSTHTPSVLEQSQEVGAYTDIPDPTTFAVVRATINTIGNNQDDLYTALAVAAGDTTFGTMTSTVFTDNSTLKAMLEEAGAAIQARVIGGITIYTADAEPGSCVDGDIWIDTNGTTAQRLYVCEEGTFVLSSGAGGSSLPACTTDGDMWEWDTTTSAPVCITPTPYTISTYMSGTFFALDSAAAVVSELGVITASSTTTLTNKTVDGDDNTVQDIADISLDMPPHILSSTQTLTDLHGNYIITGAYTITLSAVESGDWGCFQVYGAYTGVLDPNAVDLIILDGVAGSDGVAIQSSGTTADSICLQYYDTTGWISWGNNGWTSQ